jgi:hypothetical protein
MMEPDKMPDRRLPTGMTPRLLSRDAAAAYCGISQNHFEEHVVPAVPPVKIGERRLWDVKALNIWLDRQSGLLQHHLSTDDWAEKLGNDSAGKGR